MRSAPRTSLSGTGSHTARRTTTTCFHLDASTVMDPYWMSVMHKNTNTVLYVHTVGNIVYLFISCKTLLEKKITVHLLIQFNSRTLSSSQFKRSMKVALEGSTCHRLKGYSSRTHIKYKIQHTSKVLGVLRQSADVSCPILSNYSQLLSSLMCHLSTLSAHTH